MKNIKNLMLITVSICFLLFAHTITFATNNSLQLGAYNLNGERDCIVNITLNELIIKEENSGSLLKKEGIDKEISVTENILSVANEGENFIYMDIKTDNPENPYPEIEPTAATVMLPQATGNVRQYIGKNYRLYFAVNKDATLENISDKITDTSLAMPKFSVEKLGIYIMVFDPKVYDVTFYSEEPVYEDGNWINQDCIYEKIEDLEYKDTIEFPEIPQKEGYVFTGWKARHFSGGGYDTPFKYTLPQPIKVSTHREFFATWCLEGQYEPINIEISSNEPITKGNENGKKITLKTNYGVFVKDDEFPAEWRTEYEAEPDENIKQTVISEWKSKWNVVGNDEIMIETATRIDDKTVELVLSGSSIDKYTSSNILIEFDSSLLLSDPTDEGNGIVFPPDSKIKMDAVGIRSKMYCSDNSLTLFGQNRPSSGGGGITLYTVAFDTNGGNAISKQNVRKNTSAKEPEIPQKEGYIFKGWYEDKELTNKFDFTTKITKKITLYAKWDVADKTKNQIIFTVGKTDVSVFGEEKQNDVAPIIKGDRAFLPARFVAESLEAVVKWDNDTRTVTITKDDIFIVITIGAETAIVNDEVIVLDYPAFIENNRTYTPIRFVAEKLGSTVDWNPDSLIITITK